MLGRKKSKHFLEQKEALELATSIGEVQEVKALTKAEKHHQAQPGHPRPERIPKVSMSKRKIKDTKALIAARRARSKKDRAKSRRVTSGGTLEQKPAQATSRKSVSFT